MDFQHHVGSYCENLLNHRLTIELLEPRMLFSTAMLDPSFAGTGYTLGPTEAPTSGAFFSTAEGLAMLPNGQALVAGQVSIGTTNGIYVQRYNADGSVDETFGTGDGYDGANGYAFIGGSLYPNASADNPVVIARLAVDAAGDIVVGESNAGIVRLTGSGAIDDSFGSGGFVSIPTLTDLAIVSGSKIIVSTSSGIVERFTSSGEIDSTFGSTGQTQLSIMPGFSNDFGFVYGHVGNPSPMPLAVQPDGEILVGGVDTSHDLAVQRLSVDGTIDPTFGSAGIASAGFNSFLPNTDGIITYPKQTRWLYLTTGIS